MDNKKDSQGYPSLTLQSFGARFPQLPLPLQHLSSANGPSSFPLHLLHASFHQPTWACPLSNSHPHFASSFFFWPKSHYALMLIIFIFIKSSLSTPSISSSSNHCQHPSSVIHKISHIYEQHREESNCATGMQVYVEQGNLSQKVGRDHQPTC